MYITHNYKNDSNILNVYYLVHVYCNHYLQQMSIKQCIQWWAKTVWKSYNTKVNYFFKSTTDY